MDNSTICYWFDNWDKLDINKLEKEYPIVGNAYYSLIKTEKRKKMFLLSRIALKKLVSSGSGRNVSIYTAKSGKVKTSGGGESSISYSGDMLVVAVGNSSYLGVDVEEIKKPSNALVNFVKKTNNGLFSLKKEDIPPFYLAWTVAESAIKAKEGSVFKDFRRLKVKNKNKVYFDDNECFNINSFLLNKRYVLSVASNHTGVSIIPLHEEVEKWKIESA